MMNEQNNNQAQNNKKWIFIFFMLNSTVLHSGARVLTGYYKVERSALSHFLLTGIITAIFAAAIEYLTLKKSVRFRGIVAAGILVMTIIVVILKRQLG